LQASELGTVQNFSCSLGCATMCHMSTRWL
jgi:hypothetical protein